MPSLRVLNISFDCPTPYEQGQILGTSEASELNRSRIKHVLQGARNRVARNKARGIATTSAELSELALAFTFAQGFEPPIDPAALEATKLARALAHEALTKRGETAQGIGQQAYASLLASLVALPAVQAEANRRTRATQAIAQASIFEQPSSSTDQPSTSAS